MSLLLDPALRARAEALLARYPHESRQSALVPLLHLFMEAGGGCLAQAHQEEAASFLGVPLAEVHEAATFYSMSRSSRCESPRSPPFCGTTA